MVGRTECCRGTEDRDGADRRMAGLKQQRNVGYISAGIRSEIQDQASAIVGDSMVRQIRKHRAVWYPGAEEMLTALKNRGYHLVILSNCKVAYRKAHWEEFRMERWFEQFYDCESYGFCPKTEIVQEVIRDYPGPYLVIGDRRQDLECARSCKSPFIGCLYGYGEKGELDGADYFVKSVEEITGII